MEILKILGQLVIGCILFALLMSTVSSCEHANSPIVNGSHIGSGYECHDGTLYVVSGSGNGRSIAPSFNRVTGELVSCSK